jgi:dihydroneopterin aldolase
VPEEERKVPQEISVSFRVYYNQLPVVCETDDIEQGMCYNQMADIIKHICNSRSFKTIEYLSHELYKALKPTLPESDKLRIFVEKCKPPVAGVLGSVGFECGD